MEKEYYKQKYSKKDLEDIKSGIDTLGISYKTSLDIESLKGVYGALDKYTIHTTREEITLVLKPSLVINGGVEPTNIKETINFIQEIEIKLGLENGMLKRVDFSVDIKQDFYNNKKLYRLFLECLEFKRKGLGVFETKKPLEQNRSTGNLKITSKRVQTTIYDCEDKKRLRKIRVENRILDIRTLEKVEKRIIYELNNYIKELDKLELIVPMIEDKYIFFLVKEYNKTIGKQFRTFTEFIAWADYEGLILTERVLKEVLKASKIKTRYNNFVTRFRELRKETLNFTTKTELKKFIQIIKKSLKKMTS